MQPPSQPFDDRLRALVSERLASHQRTSCEPGDLRHAAVAITVVGDERAGACFLLTRRASRMRTHSSQWALPGGRVDAGESAEEAAARELDEELGVTGTEVLGLLDDYPTRSGYRITPVVLWAPQADVMVPNPAEVEAAYRIPLSELLREDAPRFADHPEVAGPVLQMPIHDRLIHAPTAAVLYQFREVVLRGESVRVAHFEQPPFAWR